MLGYCGAWGASGWLLMVGLWAGFIALVVWVVSRLFPSGQSPDALDVLDRRLAAGEIDSDDYRRLHDELAGQARPTGGRR